MCRPLILIVEDDDATAELLSDLLRAEGYDTQASSTSNLLDAARQIRPDLLLLDLAFPVFNGGELLRTIRSDHDLRDLPVILLSTTPHLAEVAEHLPIQGYLSKPFELDRLLQTVSNLVPSQHSPDPGVGLCWSSAGLASSF